MNLTPAQSTSNSPERYRGFFDLARFPAGDNRELVYSPLTRKAQLLSVPAVRLLQGCRTFATLEEHTLKMCRELNLGPDEAPAIRQHLCSLADTGLLVS